MNKKKITLLTSYAFLVSILFLGIIFTSKLFPMISFGSDTTNLQIEKQLEKYINYYLREEDKGTLVQYELKTKIEYGEERTPVEESQIVVNLSQIEEKYPYEVKVISENGFESTSEYHSDTGILTIDSKEQKENVENKYIIICYYDTYQEEVERDLAIKVTAKSIFSGVEERTVSKEESFHDLVAENIGELTSINQISQEIYNGYIKSNVINGTNYGTQYDQIEKIMVSKKEAQEIIETEESNSFTKQDVEFENNHNIIYRSTKIQKSAMDQMLGPEGKLEILDEEKNTIETIDQETPFDENGIYTIVYEKQPEKIRIKTSEIISEGILNLRHTKEIIGDLEEVQELALKTKIQLNGRENSYEFQNEIKEATTEAKVNVDQLNWTNEQQNEVTFDIHLEAYTERNNMFKNPYIKIELPNQVEKVILGESHIIYANQLELQNPYMEISENGNKVIVIALKGTQTTYHESELGLTTNIKIPVTIILKKEIEERSEEKLKVTYANQYTFDDSYEIKEEDIEVQIENNKEDSVYDVTHPIMVENTNGLIVEVTPTRATTELRNNDVVYEGEYIKYNIKITNTSQEDIENVKVEATIPEGVTYGELYTEFERYLGKYKYQFNEQTRKKTIDIGVVQAEKTVTIYYEVKVNALATEEKAKKIHTNINTFIGEEIANNYEITNTVESAEVEMFLSTMADYGGWTYDLNIFSKEDKEVTVKIHVPKVFCLEEIDYLNHTLEDPSTFSGTPEDHANPVYTNYESLLQQGIEPVRDLEIEISEDNVITTKLKTNSCYMFKGQIKKEEIERPFYSASVELFSYAEAIGNHTYFSNENRIEILYQKVNAYMSSPTEGETLTVDQEIEYDVKIENIGQNNVEGEGMPKCVFVNIVDFIPEGIEAEEVTYDTWVAEEIEINQQQTQETERMALKKQEGITENISGELRDEEGNKIANLNINILIPKGESVTVKIKAHAKAVEEETKAENYAIIGGEELDTQTTNIITNTILPYDYDEPVDEPDDPDDSDDIIDPDDSNDLEEDPKPSEDPGKTYSLSGMAWNDENEDGRRETGEKVLNGITVMLVNVEEATKIQETTQTNAEGKYQFNKIETGNYLVLFSYDTNQYQLTEYQKLGVSSTTNSDVTDKTVTLDGKKVMVGVTNHIELKESIGNIDIGLINNKICDFKIEKSISSVTVKTSSGTNQYQFKDSNLAKVEIKGNEIEGAKVTIQYKIKVTNVGEAEGTIGKIVEYLPEGLDFSINTNTGWIQGEKNQIVNKSIANRKMKKGESIQLSLTATKQMTANSTGTFKNRVEIQEITNKTNTKDNNEKNNSSSADLILSIKTGMIVYTSIMILAILIILSIIAFYLYKNKKGKITFLILLFCVTIFIKAYDVQAFWWGHDYYFDYDEVANVALHRFFGGPVKVGYCGNHNLQAYSTNYNHWYDEHIRTIGTTTTTKQDFTLVKNASREVKMKYIEKDKYYIFGPFSFTKTGTSGVTYSYTVKKNDSGKTEFDPKKVTMCDSEGKEKSLNESSESEQTFYIKIKEKDCEDGISKVTLKVKGNVIKTIKRTNTYTAVYFYASYAQPVRCGPVEGETSEDSKDDKELSIDWTTIPGRLIINKIDKDTKEPLKDVKFRIICEKNNYDETKKTNKKGQIIIDNLATGKYTITEMENNNPGYIPQEVNQIKNITKGKKKTITIKNKKGQPPPPPPPPPPGGDPETVDLELVKTGFIPLTKEVRELSNVGFSIKVKTEPVNGTGGLGSIVGKYVNVDEEDNVSYTNHKQVFYTDEGGRIRIEGLLQTYYTVTEEEVKFNGRGEENYGFGPVGGIYPEDSKPSIEAYPNGSPVGFSNEYVFGNLLIQKIAQDSKKGISGIQFKIQSLKQGDNYLLVDEEKNVNYTANEENATIFTTDSNGIIKVENLEIGAYKIIELKTSERYSVEQEEIIVQVEKGTNLSDLYTDMGKIIESKRDHNGNYQDWYHILVEEEREDGLYRNIPEDFEDVVANHQARENEIDSNTEKEIIKKEIQTNMKIWKDNRQMMNEIIEKSTNYNENTKNLEELIKLKDQIKEYYKIYFLVKDKRFSGAIDKQNILNLPMDFQDIVGDIPNTFNQSYNRKKREIEVLLEDLEEEEKELQKLNEQNESGNRSSELEKKYQQLYEGMISRINAIISEEENRIDGLERLENGWELINDLTLPSNYEKEKEKLMKNFQALIQATKEEKQIINQIYTLREDDPRYEDIKRTLENSRSDKNKTISKIKFSNILDDLYRRIDRDGNIEEETKRTLQQKITQISRTINDLPNTIQRLNEGIYKRVLEIKEKEEEIKTLQNEIDQIEKEKPLESELNQLTEKLEKLNELDKLLANYKPSSGKYEVLQKINSLLKELGFRYGSNLTESGIRSIRNEISKRKEEISKTEEEILEKQRNIQTKKANINKIKKNIASKRNEMMESMKDYINKYNQEKMESGKTIATRENIIRDIYIKNRESLSRVSFMDRLIFENQGRHLYEYERYYYSVIVDMREYIYQKIENQVKMKLEVKKIDEDSKKGINGAKFRLYGSNEQGGIDKSKEIGTYETGIGMDRKGNMVEGIFTTPYIKQGIYYLEEIEAPYPYELPNPNNPIRVDLRYDEAKGNTESCTVEVTNKRTFINLSGIVWEDIVSSHDKEQDGNHMDGLYKSGEGENDKILQGIRVNLKDKKGNIVQFVDTNNMGGYQFTHVRIDQLSEYYIEFEYNGMCYENVIANINPESDEIEEKPGSKDNVWHVGINTSSKAEEDGREEKNRTNFNENYDTISYGQANNRKGNKTYNLYYNQTKDESILLYQKEQNSEALIWGYEENKNSGKPVSGVDSQYMIRANTKNAYQNKSGNNSGYLDNIISPTDIRKNAISDITNINLGLKKREEVDLKAEETIQSVKVHINGQDHIYRYADLYQKNGEENKNQNLYPSTKFDLGTEYATTALYASDINYGGDDKLSVKVTYRLAITNASNLRAEINEVVNYCDIKYTDIKAGKEINEDGTIKEEKKLECTKLEPENEKYTKTIIGKKIGGNLLTIEARTKGYIYVELTVNPKNIVDILGRKEGNEKYVKLDNAFEITSYSIKDKEGKSYAAIDKNSQPGNTSANGIEVKEYEDDTAKAPGMKLVLQEERKVKGTVFVDKVDKEEVMEGQVRQGDGKYEEEKEEVLSGVKVQMVDLQGKIAQVWKEEENRWQDAETETDENGNYTIGGFIPDHYTIKYIWGDKEHKVQDYKSTIVDQKSYDAKGNQTRQNVEWYKDEFKQQYPNVEWDSTKNSEIRRSDAIDNYETRQKIDAQSENMINRNKGVIEEYEGNIKVEGREETLITKMDSSTPVFKVNIEYHTDQINAKDVYKMDENNELVMDGFYARKKEGKEHYLRSVDFGIVRRAEQQLELKKDVAEIKITLANGNTIVHAVLEDGKLKDKVNHTVYLSESSANAQIKTEMDSEIIEGAQLHIKYKLKVENKSELEYLNQNFYKYGKGYGEDENDLVTLTAEQIVDYLDNKISVDETQDPIEKVLKSKEEKDSLFDQGLLKEDEKGNMRTLLNSTKNILILKNGKALKPKGTDKSTEIYLEETKLLANIGEEDHQVENHAEIIKIQKSGGATIKWTPGNYIPSDSNTSELDDDRSESVTIVPPTGKDLNYTSMILLAISSLSIVSAGIILIKKFALKGNN